MPPQPADQSVSTTPFALVFTDVVGSSAAKRAAALGADASARDRAYLQSVQTRYLHLVRETIATHHGKEIMTIGDAFFLTFEDAGAALICASEIQIKLRSQAIMTSTGQLKLRIGALRAKAPDVAGASLAGAAMYEAEYGNCPDATSLAPASPRRLEERRPHLQTPPRRQKRTSRPPVAAPPSTEPGRSMHADCPSSS